MAFSLTNTNAGDVNEEFIRVAIDGDEFPSLDSFDLRAGINKSLTFPKLSIGTLWQANAATPSSSGTITIGEVVLSVNNFMAYTEYNPETLRPFWAPYAPSPGTPFVWSELPEMVRVAIANEILRQHRSDMETAVWQGSKNFSPVGSGANAFFDGIISRADDSASVNKIGSAVAITDANVIAKLQAVYDAFVTNSIVSVREHPDFTIWVSYKTRDHYFQAVEDLTNKGQTPVDSGTSMYKGKKLKACFGMPDDVIFATVGGTTSASNLALGVTNQENHQLVKNERLQANSELHFFQMRMAAQTTIKKEDECVLYNGGSGF